MEPSVPRPPAICGDVVLDPAFGTAGTATFEVPGCDYDSRAQASAIQADGRIVLGGQYYTAAIGRTAALARLRADGSLDPTFGTDGYVESLFDVPSAIVGLAILDDGRIVASGQHNGRLMVMRLLPDGSFDPSFAGVGWTVASEISVDDWRARNQLALTPDGGILVVGSDWIDQPVSSDFAVVRFSADGTLDASYGDGGIARADVSGAGDVAYTLHVDEEGRVVAAGLADGDFGLARFDARGRLDEGFGAGGMVRTDLSGQYDEIHGLAEADGRLIAVGCADCETYDYLRDSDWALAAYDAQGALDPNFGEGGTVRTNVPDTVTVGPGTLAGARTVQVLQGGALLVAGYVKFNSWAGRMVLGRYTAEGEVDPCFGDGGFYVQHTWSGDVMPQSDIPSDLLSDREGRIVLVGTANPSAWGRFAIARILPR
jgi:uncharacterized delta-60 repeat protein